MSKRPIPDDSETTRVANVTELGRELGGEQRDVPYLIVLAGANVGEMYRVDGGELVLGRASGARVRLLDDGISRKHARLSVEGDQVFIEDLQSSNGTRVNGERITRRALADGDKILLGSTTILKFSYHDRLDLEFQQRMYDAALRDALTRAFNKKYLVDRLDTEIAYARRHGTPLSLVLFDIDHFKRINDTWGHIAGDHVLARLAQITQQTVRAEDVFARYGGEEFAVLCRGVPLASAGVLAERLRVLVEATSFDDAGTRIPVTISAGVAAYPDVAVESGPELVAAADEALYQAKRGGRNRVLLKYGTAR